MTEKILGIVFVWLLIGVVVFCDRLRITNLETARLERPRLCPPIEATILIVFWPLRVIGVLK